MTVRRKVLGSVLVLLAVMATSCSSDDAEKPKIDDTPATDAGTKLGNENIARFERLVEEGLNRGELEVMDELLSPTVVDHQYYGPGYPPSRGGVKGLTAALRTAFPDLHAVASTLVASNDGTQTFAIIKTTGTFTGPYLGVPPNGSKIALDIQESARWEKGKMVEHWGVADNIGLLTQMKFFPEDAFPAYDESLLAVEYRKQLENPREVHPITAKTVEDRLAACRRAIDVGVNEGDMWVDSEIVADPADYEEKEFYGRGFPDGVDRHKVAIGVNRTALPDLHTTTHQLVAIGDGSMVFGILEAKGTNTGPFLGIPPTGKPIDIDVFEFWRFNKDGKVVEHNGVADLLGLIDDMGFIPPGAVPEYTKDKVDQQFRAELDLN
jgi:predicted ester cyclase